MSGVGSSSKARALTLYAIAWLVVLAAGAAGLMALREWGWSQIEEKHARAEFAKARDTFDRGDVIRAQKTIVRLLLARPERLAGALAAFDTDTLGMPAAAAAVSVSPELPQLSSTEQLRQVLIFEGADAALEHIKAMSAKEYGERDVTLWHARLLLNEGNFDDAKKRFGEYWKGHAEERRDVVDLLTPGGDELKRRGAGAADQLFAMGLWDEAEQVAEQALSAGAKDPGLGFYLARMAESEEGKAAAIAKYERVLEALPTHDLTLRRVLVLSQQE